MGTIPDSEQKRLEISELLNGLNESRRFLQSTVPVPSVPAPPIRVFPAPIIPDSPIPVQISRTTPSRELTALSATKTNENFSHEKQSKSSKCILL